MIKKDDVIAVIKEYIRNQIDEGGLYIDIVDFTVDIMKKIEEIPEN